MTSLELADLLPRVQAPTLVLEPRHIATRGGAGQWFASLIPDSRLVLLEKEAIVDPEETVQHFNRFLAEGTEGDEAEPSLPSGMTAILFADIADSTGLTERLGDGVLAVFTSARRAIEAALACGRSGDDAGLPLHLGLHVGDVTREEDPDGRGNVYGGAVNIAARISALAAPGEVLVSQTVRDLARTSAGVSFEARGERELKGVSDPVRVYEVRLRQ